MARDPLNDELYGGWADRWPSDVADLLEGYSGMWWIGGGYALDAATGRDRDHADIDIVIPRSELSLLRGWIGLDLHVWAAFQGALKPLRPSDSGTLPIGCTNVWMRRSAYSQWEYDVLLDPSDGDTWRFRRDPAISMPLADALVEHDGIRYAKPETVLAYLAHMPGREGELDPVLDALDADARSWLATVVPDEHPWRQLLA